MPFPFLPQAKRIVQWPAGHPEDKEVDFDLLKKLSDQVIFAEKGPMIAREPPVFVCGPEAEKSTRCLNIQLPNLYMVLLKRGRVLGRTVAVINRDKTIFGDISIDWRHPRVNHKYRGWKYVRSPLFVKGRSLCLAATGAETFSHLLFDSLGRLWLAEKAGMPSDYFDTLIVQNDSETLRAFLRLFGWQKPRVVDLSVVRNVECEELFAASYQSGLGHYHPDFINWIRTKTLSFFQEEKMGPEWIFLSRSAANSRRLLNEMEIYYSSKNYRNFSLVVLEKQTLFNQIRLFLNAKGIVAPHGAGLTHLCWAAPFASILEFFPNGFFNGYYWDLASGLKMRYGCLQGTEGRGKRAEISDYSVNVLQANAAFRSVF